MPIRPPGRRWRPGVSFLATELFEGRIALPELLDDLAQRGISSVLVEGGAETARGFLDEGLVDRIVLFAGTGTLERRRRRLAARPRQHPGRLPLRRDERFGADRCLEWARGLLMFTGIVTDIGTVRRRASFPRAGVSASTAPTIPRASPSAPRSPAPGSASP